MPGSGILAYREVRLYYSLQEYPSPGAGLTTDGLVLITINQHLHLLKVVLSVMGMKLANL